MKIILASASPRRRELLAQIGLEFEVMVSQVEEKATQTDAALLVEELSAQKAEAVMALAGAGKTGMHAPQEAGMGEMHAPQEAGMGEVQASKESGIGELKAPQKAGMEEVLVIGADTVVAVGGRILGKPSGAEEAVRMLSLLSGNTHEVHTGVTLLYKSADGVRRKTFHETTRVTFYPMSQREISGYAATGDCLDKAGAYGIQGFCARYIRGIEGDYNNVVGLPVGRLYQEAREWLEN